MSGRRSTPRAQGSRRRRSDGRRRSRLLRPRAAGSCTAGPCASQRAADGSLRRTDERGPRRASPLRRPRSRCDAAARAPEPRPSHHRPRDLARAHVGPPRAPPVGRSPGPLRLLHPGRLPGRRRRVRAGGLGGGRAQPSHRRPGRRLHRGREARSRAEPGAGRERCGDGELPGRRVSDPRARCRWRRWRRRGRPLQPVQRAEVAHEASTRRAKRASQARAARAASST